MSVVIETFRLNTVQFELLNRYFVFEFVTPIESVTLTGVVYIILSTESILSCFQIQKDVHTTYNVWKLG